ncbi:MAG: hypothetical protein JXR52_01195 [Bacteroidales bacterium]|nr:hypothetical protein [Bacteroidales bacterium]MBN2697412.1 hypothetical protein [Bacteroidales bacterium]
MHFLILSVLSSTAIFIIFKILELVKLPSFPVILLNYLFAALLGFLLNPVDFRIKELPDMDWIFISVPIGILFIIMFFILARSSQKAGISVTSVAGKMSVVFPIILSLIISSTDVLSPLKFIAIIMALTGVALTIIKPGTFTLRIQQFYLPVILFLGMGLVDSLVKLAQHLFVDDDSTALFSALVFCNAFISGIIFLLFCPDYLKWFRQLKIWGYGALLGTANFGSIFFLVRALNYRNFNDSEIDSSIIFGINNIGIVSLSVLCGMLLFREQLKIINWIGIITSATAIILFSLS